MPSKYEILEFLRIKGGKSISSELYKVFGNGGSVRTTINELVSQGFIKKRKVKVPTKNGKYRELIEIELNPKAYNMLKKYNVESFYDLPFAKAREEWFKEVFGRGFIRFDKV